MVAKGTLKINMFFFWHPVVACLFFLLFSSFECMLSVAIVVEGRAECPKLALAMKSRPGGTQWVSSGPVSRGTWTWLPNFYQWGGPLIFPCHWGTVQYPKQALAMKFMAGRTWWVFRRLWNPNFYQWGGPLIFPCHWGVDRKSQPGLGNEVQGRQNPLGY